MRRGLRLVPATVAVAVAFAGVAGSEGCRTPTQITVELRTFGDLPCASLKGVAIVVARTREDAEAKMKQGSFSAEVPRGTCDPDGHTIGTLVVTPQDSTGAIIVRARLSDDPKATCAAPDYLGCIVARRSFSFIDHASITLPIALEVACLDVPCDVKTSCRSGSCVSSDATCSETSGTCDSAAQPVRLPDGGVLPPDGAGRPDGARPTDSGAPDAFQEDAPLDAPRDVESDQFGNGCPTTGGDVDCTAMAKLCCYQGPYFCQTTCMVGVPIVCIGRKYCGAGFCCGDPPDSGPVTFCDTTSEQRCSQNGNHYLCTTAADCPAKLPKCNGVYFDAGPTALKQCSLN